MTIELLKLKRECFANSNWESKKDNFKTRFPILTDSDLVFQDTMIENLQRKLGMSSDELSITILTL